MLLNQLFSLTITGVFFGLIGTRNIYSQSDYILDGISSLVVACLFVFIFKGQDSLFEIVGKLTYMGIIQQMTNIVLRGKK